MCRSLRCTELSDEEVEALEAVAIRSTSWLGLPTIDSNRSGEASRSALTNSRSASFMMGGAIEENEE
jgi:hypothetical protein